MPLKKLLGTTQEDLKHWADNLYEFLNRPEESESSVSVLQRIRGTIVITGTNVVGSTAISVSDVEKCDVRFLGSTTTSSVPASLGYIEALTDPTEITARRASSSSATTTVGFEITEYE